MKKLVYAIACALAVASCNQDAAKKAEQIAQQQRDSLEQIISQKDNEINDMMTTLSDIEEGFREITEAQSRVTLAKQGEGTNTMQRIKENFQFIQAQMQQNKEFQMRAAVRALGPHCHYQKPPRAYQRLH